MQSPNPSPQKANGKKYALDPQSGQWFEIHPEDRSDTIAAQISIIYLLLMTIGLMWLLFDVWVGQYSLVYLLGYAPKDGFLNSSTFHLIAYTMIGGALGGVINGIRSFLVWHGERSAFGRRFVWKYIALPWLGASLALFVYALVLGGVVAFSGNALSATVGLTQSLAAFAIGGLSGYGSGDVFKWLDAQVSKIFKVAPSDVKVPNLAGMTREEAEAALKNNDLILGAVTNEVTNDESKIDRVIKQSLAAETTVAPQTAVDITLGAKA